LRSEVQPAQTDVSTANAVVDSSNPIHTQLSAVHNNNDIGSVLSSRASAEPKGFAKHAVGFREF